MLLPSVPSKVVSGANKEVDITFQNTNHQEREREVFTVRLSRGEGVLLVNDLMKEVIQHGCTLFSKAPFIT